MSDKLLKNDLTPYACQNDENLGQVVISSVFLILPAVPSTTP